jgi:hypothetical protein
MKNNANKLITAQWEKMNGILKKNGVRHEQRHLLCQSFFGGADFAVKHLAVGFDTANTPEDFEKLITAMMFELKDVTEHGVPTTHELLGEVNGSKGAAKERSIIIMPGEDK